MAIFRRLHRYPGVVFGLLAFAVTVVGISGFTGFRVFPSLGVPSAAGATLLGFAAAAGMASFFSPCSFPLLVTLLTRQTAAGGSPKIRAVRFAAALSLGAAAFLLLMGASLGAGGAALFKEITFTSNSGRLLRSVVGAVLVVLGLMQAGWIRWHFGGVAAFTKRRLRIAGRLDDRPTLKFGLFGFAYLLAGFG